MKWYGIAGKALNRAQSLLSGRKQRVQHGNSYSRMTDFTSGIPQCSILNPILFSIFINDVTKAILLRRLVLILFET